MPPCPSAGAAGPADSDIAQSPNDPGFVVVIVLPPKSPPGPELKELIMEPQ